MDNYKDAIRHTLGDTMNNVEAIQEGQIDITDRLLFFEANQKNDGDEYGAEVLYRARLVIKRLREVIIDGKHALDDERKWYIFYRDENIQLKIKLKELDDSIADGSLVWKD